MSETSPPNGPPQGRPNKWLKRGLIASLAVNLLIIGTIIGAAVMWKKHGHHFRHGRGQDFGMFALLHRVPGDRRRELRGELRDIRKGLRPYMKDIHDARREAADVLSKEPFDPTALRAAVEAVAAKKKTLNAVAIDAFILQAEKLSADERATLAKLWKKRRHGKKPWWRRGPKPEEKAE